MFLENCNLPDILLITEHWLFLNEPCHIPNYNIVSKYCRTNTTGNTEHGGTLIFMKSDIRETLQFVGVNKYDYLLVEKEFEFSIVYNKLHNMYIICIYRPDSNSPLSFVERLENLITGLPAGCKTVISGDFNIDFDEKYKKNAVPQ